MRASSAIGAMVALLLAGCDTPIADTSSTTDTDRAADQFPVSGVVLDLNDNPVVDVFVTVSTEFCIPDRTDPSGAFQVEDVTSGEKRLIVYGETAKNGPYASLVFPFEAAQEIELPSAIYTPRLRESWPIDPGAAAEQVVLTADGLQLTIAAQSLTLAPFALPALLVARVPVASAPDFVPDDIQLIDLFVLHPIQSTFDPPAAATFPADASLQPGTRVLFHSLDYDTGLLIPVAKGTVDDTGRPVTNPGEGLPELTWVGVSVE